MYIFNVFDQCLVDYEHGRGRTLAWERVVHPESTHPGRGVAEGSHAIRKVFFLGGGGGGA